MIDLNSGSGGKVETHEFDAQVERLLDLVVHALYSDREIFLRELVTNAADAMDRRRFEALCLTLAYTGCRISEALALTAGAIDPDGGCIAIRCLKKRGRAQVIRIVPVPPVLLDALAGLHDPAIPDAGARLWNLSRSRAWFLVKQAMTRADIPPGPHRTPKGLRHGFGLHAVRCGVPITLLQRWLGHASLATTAIYLQLVGEEERAFAQRMWG